MTKAQAEMAATDLMLNYLRGAREFTPQTAKEFGLTFRELDGRWNVYSVDLDQWHVMVSDNGGRIEQMLDCSRV